MSIDSDLAQCGIDRHVHIDLLECADWALHNRCVRDSLGTHLDYSDEWLDYLAARIRKYMNPEDSE